VGASLWPLGWIAVIVGQVMYFTWQVRQSSDRGVDLSLVVPSWWLLTAFLFGPPALLLVVWSLARRRLSSSQPRANSQS
jgi:hypothetical protein